MAKVWVIMLISAILTLLFRDPSAAVNAMVSGSHNAVELSLQLLALYSLWLGFFGIVERTGIADKLAWALKPIVKFLFPNISDEGRKYVTMNISANLLGLGNAATPMAINAVKAMDAGSETATENMKMLLVLSSTSLQLLPTTVIGLRASHGSVNPTDFLLAELVATVLSTFLGVITVKIIQAIKKRQKRKKPYSLKHKRAFKGLIRRKAKI